MADKVTPLEDYELVDFRHAHRPQRDNTCFRCHFAWPCGFARAAARIEQDRAEIVRLTAELAASRSTCTMLQTQRNILRTWWCNRNATRATHWFGAECIAAGCPLPKQIEKPLTDRVYQHREEKAGSEKLDQLNATLDRVELALTAMNPNSAAREIARLTAEIARLTKQEE